MRSQAVSNSDSSEEMTITLARLGQFPDQTDDLGLGPDIDPCRRFVEDQDFGSVASHLPITTFCWLPPDSVDTAWSRLAVLIDRRAIMSSAMSRTWHGPRTLRRDAPDHRHHHVVGNEWAGMMPGSPAPPAPEAMPCSTASAGRRIATFAPLDADFAETAGSIPAMTRAKADRPEPSKPASPSTSPDAARS